MAPSSLLCRISSHQPYALAYWHENHISSVWQQYGVTAATASIAYMASAAAKAAKKYRNQHLMKINNIEKWRHKYQRIVSVASNRRRRQYRRK